MQPVGVDFEETYSPVASLVTTRLLVALAVEWKVEIHQMDVKTAFLNGDLDEDIYMKQREGFVDQNHPTWVCKLSKAIYGLKQVPRQWYKKIKGRLQHHGLTLSLADNGLFTLSSNGEHLLLGLYVDDIVLVSTCPNLRNRIKNLLSSEFQMTDLGKTDMILGIEVS